MVRLLLCCVEIGVETDSFPSFTVAITPAAGVVAGWGAILLGLGSGTVPWVTMNILGKTKFFRQVDDTLEVFHTHFVGALVGGIGTGKLRFVTVFTGNSKQLP